jgi:hypothetical protein
VELDVVVTCGATVVTVWVTVVTWVVVAVTVDVTVLVAVTVDVTVLVAVTVDVTALVVDVMVDVYKPWVATYNKAQLVPRPHVAPTPNM